MLSLPKAIVLQATKYTRVQAKFDCSYAEFVVMVMLQGPCIVLQKRSQDAKGPGARKTL